MSIFLIKEDAGLIYKYNFFWYENGEPGAKFDAEGAPIGWYLENELRYGPESCDEILYEIKRIESDAVPRVEIDGNESVLWIDTFNVKISNHYFKPPQVITLSLGEFKIIIEQWRTFMSTPKNEPPVEKA
jgi:uncharacterized protein YacL (UPF0231 family)